MVSEDEAGALVREYNEGKKNLHSFFTDVIKSEDTTKTGYLKDEELGTPKLPVRTYKELSVFSKEVAGQKLFGEYFDSMSEIITSTSLSRDAALAKVFVLKRCPSPCSFEPLQII